MIALEKEISDTEDRLIELRKQLKTLREECDHDWKYKYSNDYTGYDIYECPKCGEETQY